MEKYIHYGCKVFDKDLFINITNMLLSTKPYGGFWASRTDAAFGWKDWCASTNYRECVPENSFTFTLEDNAKVLHINSANELKKLPVVKNDLNISSWKLLDFEKLAGIYDAIDVSISNDPELHFALYGWDCDSILIMNPDIIQAL